MLSLDMQTAESRSMFHKKDWLEKIVFPINKIRQKTLSNYNKHALRQTFARNSQVTKLQYCASYNFLNIKSFLLRGAEMARESTKKRREAEAREGEAKIIQARERHELEKGTI